MPLFPDISATDDFTVEMLRQMLPNIVVKNSTTTITSDASLNNDPDLADVPLGVGTWYLEAHIFMTCTTSATPDLKTQWAFSGTWNNPLRALQGPGTSNTAGSTVITPVRMGAQATNSDAVYGLAASAAYSYAIERCFNVTVTAAGLWTLQWAQNTSDASNTNVHQGSALIARQIA